MRYTRRASLVIILGAFTAAVAGADELTTSGGKKLTGKLVAVDAEGVTFKAADAEVKVPGKEILLVDLGHPVAAPAKDARYNEIELTDGSVIRCGGFLLKGKAFELELLPGPKDVPPPRFELPMSAVFSALRGAHDGKNRDEWRKMLLTRGKRDLYVIRAADGLNLVQGTVIEGNPAGDVLTFEREDGTKTELRLSRASGGLVFSQPQPVNVPATLCKVLDVFGNTFVAQSVEVAGGGVTVKTANGVTVKYPSLAAVSRLDYAQGNVAYLSDLTPQVTTPDFPEDEKLRVAFIKDASLSGKPLTLDGQTYPKGLWVYPGTILTYNLNADFREFKALVGIDEANDGLVNTSSRATVTVEADGRVLFTGAVSRKDKPKGLTLDVKNVKTLRVTVEADTVHNGNMVVLADARVQK